MLQYALKVLVTAITVVAISEVGKRSSGFAAILASLPLTSLLAFLWLYGETGDVARIADLSKAIFWYVLPSLVLFIALPLLLNAGFGFWPALGVSCALTFGAYLLMTALLTRFGITI